MTYQEFQILAQAIYNNVDICIENLAGQKDFYDKAKVLIEDQRTLVLLIDSVPTNDPLYKKAKDQFDGIEELYMKAKNELDNAYLALTKFDSEMAVAQPEHYSTWKDAQLLELFN